MPSLRKRRQKCAKRCFCPCLLVWKSKGLDLEFHNPGSWELECLRSRRTLEIGLGTLNWQNRQGPVASAVLLLGSFRQVSTACRFLPVPMVEVEVVVLVLVNSSMVDGLLSRRATPKAVYPSICCRTRHGRAWAWAWHSMVQGMNRGAVHV